MKWSSFLLVFLLLFFNAQAQFVNSTTIDAYARTVDARTPAILAQKLTAPYKTDAEKVRAIFSWITENIAYNTIVYQKPSRSLSNRFTSIEPDDTSTFLSPLNERVAQLVIQRRVAVCDGYSRLFKTLCDYAGIRSEIIYGYGRTNYIRSGKRFVTNHTWNAVFIDNGWRLLDATWASGYVTFGDAFVKQRNESYYLASPQQFIEDHYPEFIYWTLLSNPPTLREFQHGPFRNQAYVKYRIKDFKPTSGIIEVTVGDTITFELETEEKVTQFFVSPNPYFEVGILPQITSIPFSTSLYRQEGNQFRYQFVLTSPSVNQLHVVLNDRVILQYKVQVKNNWAVR
jgi:hypothetical protein